MAIINTELNKTEYLYTDVTKETDQTEAQETKRIRQLKDALTR